MPKVLKAKERIEELRRLLHSALTKEEGICTTKVMEISKEFDIVLNKYYNLLKEKNK